MCFSSRRRGAVVDPEKTHRREKGRALKFRQSSKKGNPSTCLKGNPSTCLKGNPSICLIGQVNQVREVNKVRLITQSRNVITSNIKIYSCGSDPTYESLDPVTKVVNWSQHPLQHPIHKGRSIFIRLPTIDQVYRTMGDSVPSLVALMNRYTMRYTQHLRQTGRVPMGTILTGSTPAPLK